MKSGERYQELTYDLVVVGGGLSGMCAAIAAARHGARVAIIHSRPVFGGNASSEIRMHICGATCHGNKKNMAETGILEEILLENKNRNPFQVYSIFDSILWEKIYFQDNLDMYLNTSMYEAEKKDNRIVKIKCHQSTTEINYAFFATIFLDATGNGTLGCLAEAEYRLGSEAGHEFNEPSAPREPNAYTLGNTLMFQAEDKGYPVPFKKPFWAYTFSEEDLAFRGHGNMELYHGENGVTERYNTDSGYWWIEIGGTSGDIIAEGENLRDELMKCVYGVWDHIKNQGDHGAENYSLTWVGVVPGTRESRRLVGDYLLNENDIRANAVFKDAVAYGGWPMDEHPPLGMFHKGRPTRYLNFDGVYTIPYRCFYSKNIDNLMMAGRDISATKMGFCSTRVMGTCAVGGQAAGTAAALAIRHGCIPREVSRYMDELQQTLLKDDCYIPGYKNTDPADLARTSSIKASSFHPGFEPEKVANGISRPVDGEENCWESEGLSPDGERLELVFDGLREIHQVQLTFDPNLTGEIMPSITGKVLDAQVKNMPPELVRDYSLSVWKENRSVYSKDIRGNYQRLNIHELPDGIVGDRVVVTVKATHGYPNARIFEVRAY